MTATPAREVRETFDTNTARTAETAAYIRAVYNVKDPGELDWQTQALCAQVDPEAFFPEKGGSTREPKRVCRGCPVRVECLEYALEHQERPGIWGGVTERNRRRLARGRAQQPPAPAPAPPAGPMCPAGEHHMTADNTHINLKTSLPACTTCRNTARTTQTPLAMVTPVFVWTREAMKTRAA